MATTLIVPRRSRSANGIPARFLGPRENPRQPDKFTGQLYQMPLDRDLGIGAYVVINGPWDTFGVVCGTRQATDEQRGAHLIHLVRGIKRHSLATPVYLWP